MCHPVFSLDKAAYVDGFGAIAAIASVVTSQTKLLIVPE
jgi:hypothetical protein